MSTPAPRGLERLVARPVAVCMAILAAVVFGSVSAQRLPVDLMPDLSYPTLTLRSDYEGAAPAEVESQIARQLEEELSTLPGLVQIESVSRAGQADIVFQFAWGTEMDQVAQSLRERLSLIRLPDGVQRPLLLRYDPSLEPIMVLALAGSLDAMELRALAEEDVVRALETIPGVASVRVEGGLEREIQVRVSESVLQARGFTADALVSRLAEENINLAGGALNEGETEYLIRTVNEFQGVEDIRRLVLRNEAGQTARVEQLAEVSWTHKEREVIGRMNGGETVKLSVFKEADANIVAVAEQVRAALYGSAHLRSAPGPEAEATESEGNTNDEARGGRGGRGSNRSSWKSALSQRLPDGVTVSLVRDSSRFIEASVSEVRSAGLWGGILAVLVLFVFLRQLRATAIIGLSIPISVAVTFAPLHLLGVSLNLMSLGGLALVIGMLVDNSVVVLESIVRCREEGDDTRTAAVRGTREVSGAVLASTATTVAVFLPLAFVEGIAGQLFGNLALTVVCGLIASLFVALFLIPTLAALELRLPTGLNDGSGVVATPPKLGNWWADLRQGVGDGWRWVMASRPRVLLLPLVATFVLARSVLLILGYLALLPLSWVAILGGRLAAFMWRLAARGAGGPIQSLLAAFERRFESLRNGYRGVLRSCLRAPSLVLTTAVVLSLACLSLVPRIGSELLPELAQGELMVNAALPVGSPLHRTASVIEEMEELASQLEGVESVYAVAGAPQEANNADTRGEHSASLLIRLSDGGNVRETEEQVRAGLRAGLSRIPDLSYHIERPSLFSLSSPLEVQLAGDDLEELRQAADWTVERLQRLDGLSGVRTDLQAGFPELHIRYERERLAAWNLDISQVARTVRDKIQGRVATGLHGGNQRIDIRVIAREEDRDTRLDLERMNINPRQTPLIPLSAVAEITSSIGPSEIRRLDQQRTAVIEAQPEGLDLGTMAGRIESSLRSLPFENVSYEITGQFSEMQQSSRSLYLALALALFLVYAIMASQFESLLDPFIILFSVPLAAVGVIIVLAVSGLPLSVIVLIGGIVLIGMVVNNAIVLIDYIAQLRDRGLGLDEAILEACSIRLRPVLITTATTVLALLPMVLAQSEGAEIRQPLALTVMAGLLSSTALTLILIPSVYRLVGRMQEGAAVVDHT